MARSVYRKGKIPFLFINKGKYSLFISKGKYIVKAEDQPLK